MILLEVGNLFGVIILIYLIAHSPAIIMVFVGISLLKKNPKVAKNLFIISGIYFIVGAGICGGMFV